FQRALTGKTSPRMNLVESHTVIAAVIVFHALHIHRGYHLRDHPPEFREPVIQIVGASVKNLPGDDVEVFYFQARQKGPRCVMHVHEWAPLLSIEDGDFAVPYR